MTRVVSPRRWPRCMLSCWLPKLETSIEFFGTLLGVENKSIATYVGVMQPDGTIQGGGHGVVMSKTGDAATFEGRGVGTMNEKGGVSWRGCLFFQSQSTKWSRLNGVAVAFEQDMDGEGNGTGAFWEWK